jgi:hypothetical protein
MSQPDQMTLLLQMLMQNPSLLRRLLGGGFQSAAPATAQQRHVVAKKAGLPPYRRSGSRGNLGGRDRMRVHVGVPDKPDTDQDERRNTHERQFGNHEHCAGRAPVAQIAYEGASRMSRRLGQEARCVDLLAAEGEDVVVVVAHNSASNTTKNARPRIIAIENAGIRFLRQSSARRTAGGKWKKTARGFSGRSTLAVPRR